jgi:hypothetical protein
MKTSPRNTLYRRSLRFAKIAGALTALAALTACASVGNFLRTTDSPLPVETLDSTGGLFSSTRAYESSDRLYVSGHMQKSFGRHIPCAAHVDVRLIDKRGRVIAEKMDDIDPSYPKSGSRSDHISYVASFPASEARQAAKIIVRYHLDGHTS